jgi:hypothetical protein
MGKLDGSCLCGKVTYACEEEPLASAICHCTECQKQSGTAFSMIVVAPRNALTIEGESLGSVMTVGTDSGNKTERRFCRECGSPIVSLSEGSPELAFIKAGTLDDKSWFEPQMHVWCDSAQPWVPLESHPGAKVPRGVPTQA